MGIKVDAAAREQHENPLRRRAALIEGDVRAVSPRDPMIWLRRWAMLHRSQALQCGLGGLAGIAFSSLFVEGGDIGGMFVPAAMGAGLVSVVAVVIYRRLLHAEIVRFVTENGPVRHSWIFRHLEGIRPKNENLRDTLVKLVDAGRIGLADAHYEPAG